MEVRNDMTTRKQKISSWFIKFFVSRLSWIVPLWYGMSMFFTRKKATPVKTFLTAEDIAVQLDGGADWREDPWSGVLDVCMHPTKFQGRLNEAVLGETDEIGDCDDHAAYWAAALLKSGLATKVWFSFLQMRKKDTGKVSGHVVCVWNDTSGNLLWADYVNPTLIVDKWDWAEGNAKARNAEVIGAAMIEVEKITSKDSLVFGTVTNSVDF